MANPTRTDVHRPGAIIPSNYSQWLDYSQGGSDGVPPIGIDCRTPIAIHNADGKVIRYETPACPDSGRCCLRSLREHASRDGRAIYGQPGKCGVCGAHFRYGSVFQHTPTGDYVHLGHDCADKYELIADWSEFEYGLDRARRTAATVAERVRKASERAEFLAKHPGLEDALSVEHRIIADIKERFVKYCSISDKQVALVIKLADEVRNPKPAAPAEVNVPAPTGRVSFTGEIVSAKVHESDYGSAIKITVKVKTDAGVWLAWMTCPQELCDKVYAEVHDVVLPHLRGRTETFTSTLQPGRDAHFAIGKRPVLGAPKVKSTRKAKASVKDQPAAPNQFKIGDRVSFAASPDYENRGVYTGTIEAFDPDGGALVREDGFGGVCKVNPNRLHVAGAYEIQESGPIGVVWTDQGQAP